MDGIAIQCLSIDAVQLEEANASQMDRSDSFKLSLYVNMKVSLMMM
jgi:hypothetical protein